MRFIIVCSLLLILISCIQSEDGLNSNCFDWPDQEFSPTNHASLTVALKKGDPAIDFTLKDTDGRSYTLSSLLATKPVLLVFGSFT
ncbi:MAG: hypothetical protein JRC57_00435 [Deltaproteobacteria bacterium]|jgi:cytochrome oxidase Cu insertion factor (SCO1/SenC/PrrC family)|nr:hypothetical protein [Deltaproteobacteria bacterium]MCK5188413.1 hypothetical protein [Deltaproteobacteria bacterium]